MAGVNITGIDSVTERTPESIGPIAEHQRGIGKICRDTVGAISACARSVLLPAAVITGLAVGPVMAVTGDGAIGIEATSGGLSIRSADFGNIYISRDSFSLLHPDLDTAAIDAEMALFQEKIQPFYDAVIASIESGTGIIHEGINGKVFMGDAFRQLSTQQVADAIAQFNAGDDIITTIQSQIAQYGESREIIDIKVGDLFLADVEGNIDTSSFIQGGFNKGIPNEEYLQVLKELRDINGVFVPHSTFVRDHTQTEYSNLSEADYYAILDIALIEKPNLTSEEAHELLAILGDMMSNTQEGLSQRVLDYIKANLGLRSAAEVAPTQFAALYEATPEFIMDKHAEAIRYGREEYIMYVLQEEKFVSGRYASKTDEWKIEKAGEYFDSMLDSFINGQDNGSLDRFVSRSPAFTLYLLSAQEDFALVSELQVAYNIVESEGNIARGEEIIAEENIAQARGEEIIAEENIAQARGEEIITEENAKQEALRKLIETLGEHSA